MRLPVLSDAAQLLKWAAQVVQQYERDYSGLREATGQVTLTANAASTTLANLKLRPTSKLFLTPTTANAAAALATTYVSTPTQGAAVINHANNAQTDRVFDFSIVGT